MAQKKPDITLRDHVYDGIQEYDQKLPNWWLFTLYSAIIFSVGYWFFYFQSNVGMTDGERINAAMNRIERIKLSNSIDVTDNDLFWKMEANPEFVAAGEATFMANCAACHKSDLSGDIGENLVDNQWKHGHLPENIYATIYDGVPEKGMPTWGGLLGQKKITEVVAFILSKHGDREKMESEAVVKTD
ncbi:cbb3-type cytochrome c oxidase N-terminal domain-containing protein [Ruficoccus sp. ZRK36]|uniref:cbb3-type cytochrome c oxidase N-terminal domain-containing protein n=1 Tax=Ruficoccus sp. ZRK36 TaxID=2866311 RepID=UPI001C72FF5C|nr:cbb3-type cytochrome c oxidase N-terminal domain-containing protein [Ruficoccus sp. ZRK36]QYY36000.1 c-type cytochrome [Ruficoccus sp. ZRK36]